MNTRRTNPFLLEEYPVPYRSTQRPAQSPTLRAESVLQSIEQSSYSASQNQQGIRPPYTHSPVEVRLFNHSEMQGGPRFCHAEDMNDEQQVVKKKHTNQGYDEMPGPSPLHNDLQRSLPVPVGHTIRYEYSGHTPNMLKRPNGLELSVRTERPQDAREVYRTGDLEQRDVPVCHPKYPQHVHSSRTQAPLHGQILVTQQQSSSHVSTRSPDESTVQKAVPDSVEHRSVQNVSYLPRNSYVSLPRQDVRTSHNIAYDGNGRIAEGSQTWDESVRTLKPALGQTSEVKGYMLSHRVIPDLKPRTSAEQSGIYVVRETPLRYQTHRSRKALPLERSLENLRPIQNRIPNGEIARPDGSLQGITFDQVVSVESTPESEVQWPQAQMQYDFVPAREVQRFLDRSVHQGEQ